MSIENILKEFELEELLEDFKNKYTLLYRELDKGLHVHIYYPT